MTGVSDDSALEREELRRRKVRILGREVRVPDSRYGRIALGVGLTAGGILGFLPVVGFWMLPLGLLVLAQDIRIVRRWRRKLTVRFSRRREKQRRRE